MKGLTQDTAQKSKTHKNDIISLLWLCICIGVFIMFIIFSRPLSDGTRSSLIFCATTVIPSLFPLLTASELLISSNAYKLISYISYPIRRILGLSERGAYAYALGTLCGFPVGAVCASRMYSEGLIVHDEFEYLTLISSSPSSAFVINAVCNGILSDRKAGIGMYICVILSGICTGLIYRCIFLHSKRFCSYSDHFDNSLGIASRFTGAIRNAVGSMLNICGFIVFFALISTLSEALLTKMRLPIILVYLINGILELSTGARSAGNLPYPISHIFCAFFLGWSGLCVMCQILSACRGQKISISRLIFCRLLVGMICALLYSLTLILSHF